MYFVRYIYFRKRHLKCGPFDKNVVILETVFWWGQIAFVCRGQKVGESSCLVVKVSSILKSKFHFREQNWNGLADYFCTPKWDMVWSICFGIFSLSHSLIILKNTPIQKENKNHQSTITITKQHSHILFVCYFFTHFQRHGHFHIFSHLAVYLVSPLGPRSYWSWSYARKFIEIEYPDIISFRHLISILHHFEEWIAKGIK